MSLDVSAVDWGQSWIRSTTAGNESQVWFRRTYLLPEHISSARAYVCSNARYRLFVNQYNINADIICPCYESAQTDSYTGNDIPGNEVAMMAYDVGNFFHNHNDTAVIAVWYAPDFRNGSDKQLSVQICGRLRSGKSFELHTDSSWICHEANAQNFPDGDEQVDANDRQTDWKAIECSQTDWHRASQSCTDTALKVTASPWMNGTMSTAAIHFPISREKNGQSVTYDFGQVYNGTIRLTLRGATKGCVIHADGLTYTCRGADDEQAFRIFTTSRARKIHIYGDEKFAPEQIVKVEMIEMKEKHNGIQY